MGVAFAGCAGRADVYIGGLIEFDSKDDFVLGSDPSNSGAALQRRTAYDSARCAGLPIQPLP